VAKKSDVWDVSVPVEENPSYWNNDPIYHQGKDLKSTKPTVVELFSGLGGFSQGFIQAGFELVAGADIHKPSVESYQHNHPRAGTILGDLKKVPASKLKQFLGGLNPTVMLAGVPCQGFSLSNRKRHDDDKRNELFRDFLRLAKVQKPQAIVIENVSGMRSASGGDVVRNITKAIETELGLEVHVVFLNASHFGVPQTRERLFFIGLPKGSKWEAPIPTHGPKGKFEVLTVKDAIGDLPPLTSGQSKTKYSKSPSSDLAKKLRGKQDVLLNHEAPNHPQATIDRISATAPGAPLYDSFRQRIRLSWDLPSPTQVSGGIRAQFQFGHPSQARGLTIRERCRIQTFPDHIWVSGGLVQARVQTGNAVPPILAEQIAKSIARALRIS
jgi:DNA (cytosine-5)-methyltransferase 1